MMNYLFITEGDGMYSLTHTLKTIIGGAVVVISYIANSLNAVFVVWAAFMIG